MVQVWFSLQPKFNSFELDSEVGRLVYIFEQRKEKKNGIKKEEEKKKKTRPRKHKVADDDEDASAKKPTNQFKNVERSTQTYNKCSKVREAFIKKNKDRRSSKFTSNP